MKGLLKQMKRRRHACKGCLGTQQASAEIIEAGIQSWRRCSGDVTNANGIAFAALVKEKGVAVAWLAS